MHTICFVFYIHIHAIIQRYNLIEHRYRLGGGNQFFWVPTGNNFAWDIPFNDV